MSYKRIDNDQVPISFQIAARREAMRAAADLRIRTPRVKWWTGDAWRHRGWIDANVLNEINLNLDALVDVDHVEFIVHHEARHLWQELNSRYLGREESEDDANRFAYRMTGNYRVRSLDGWQAVRMDDIWRL